MNTRESILLKNRAQQILIRPSTPPACTVCGEQPRGAAADTESRGRVNGLVIAVFMLAASGVNANRVGGQANCADNLGATSQSLEIILNAGSRICGVSSPLWILKLVCTLEFVQLRHLGSLSGVSIGWREWSARKTGQKGKPSQIWESVHLTICVVRRKAEKTNIR